MSEQISASENNHTLDYYDSHAEEFCTGTMNIEFTAMQNSFLSKLQAGAYILDFGCGSGRDTKYFLAQGFRVDATDGSSEMCRLAERHTGINVKCMLFHELAEQNKYDGIWACSSILHLPAEELADVMGRMAAALKDQGIIYTSFKYGMFCGERNGRYFTDMTEESFVELLNRIQTPESGGLLEMEEHWITSDARPGRSGERWLNLILRKRQTATSWR